MRLMCPPLHPFCVCLSQATACPLELLTFSFEITELVVVRRFFAPTIESDLVSLTLSDILGDREEHSRACLGKSISDLTVIASEVLPEDLL